MKKYQVLIFVLSVFLVLGIIVAFYPDNGIKITDNFSLYFPNYKKLLGINNDTINIIDVDSLINKQKDILIDNDTIDFDIDLIQKNITPLEFPENDSSCLQSFCQNLRNIKDIGRVRIMHYGDSQIEGDRITADLRNKLQSKFGGYGVGLLSAVNPYSQWSMLQSWSANWERYTGFGYVNPNIKHKKYGPMIAFCRFSPIIDDTIHFDTTKNYSAWLKFQKSTNSYANTQNFRKVVVYYGNALRPTKITLKDGDLVLTSDFLQAGEDFYTYSFVATDYLSEVSIEFEGSDSPDIYGISLEDTYGVFVDNIGLRGSSGDIFSQQNPIMMSMAYSYLKPDLILLQFGGNAVVSTSDIGSINGYLSYFKYHLYYIKQLNPQASFIVIGPSDMSVKIQDNMQSYPHLETFINSMKATAFSYGMAFWSPYKAMGGFNSMIQWVNLGLAGEDYIHFSPAGASLMSNMLYNALIAEYLKFYYKDGM